VQFLFNILCCSCYFVYILCMRILYFLLTHIASMQAVLDVGYSYACIDAAWSVYSCVDHMGEPCTDSYTIRDVWGRLTRVGPSYHVLWVQYTWAPPCEWLNDMNWAEMRAVTSITVATCFIYCYSQIIFRTLLYHVAEFMRVALPKLLFMMLTLTKVGTIL